jgi:hypothetical protein
VQLGRSSGCPGRAGPVAVAGDGGVEVDVQLRMDAGRGGQVQVVEGPDRLVGPHFDDFEVRELRRGALMRGEGCHGCGWTVLRGYGLGSPRRGLEEVPTGS